MTCIRCTRLVTMSEQRRRGPRPTLGEATTVRFTPAMQSWLQSKVVPGGRGVAGVVRRYLEDAWRREAEGDCCRHPVGPGDDRA